MHTDTGSWSLIETGQWGTLSPTYFFRFNGPGDLYCLGCARDIRLVCRTKAGVRCLDCGQPVAVDFS
jgi:hypothetical protein